MTRPKITSVRVYDQSTQLDQQMTRDANLSHLNDLPKLLRIVDEDDWPAWIVG